MQLSGGPYSYNRFDAFENSLEENRQAARSAGESEGKKMMRTAGKPAKVTGGKTHVEMGKDGKPLFSEGAGASDAHKMKAKVDAAGVKAKAKGGGIEPGAKQPDEMDEAYKGRHGQSEKEYQDGRSMAGKMISGDSKGSGANYSYKAKNTGPNPAGGSERPQGQARMNNKDRAYLQMQKGSMKKEELNNEETTDNVMENNQRMAMYSRALGVMGAHYSGPGFGVSAIEEKMADKDHDGDGKVESSKEEYFGSKDKAIKKAMAKEEYVDEGLAAVAGAATKALGTAAKTAGKQAASTAATTAGNRAGSAIGNIGSKGSSSDSRDVRVEGYKEMDPERAERQAKGKGRHSKAEQGRKIRLASAAHNDPKVGGMARAAVKDQEERNKKKGENKRGLEKAFKKDSEGHSSMEEEVSITKEMVVEYLVTEGYASNEVSAEILHTHISDEFLAKIEEQMLG